MNGGSEFNFDIDAYDLDDLLGMFRLGRDFGESDLRRARKVVMKTHPDKSGLDKEYFLFFTKAYKIVHSLHEFRARSSAAPTVYSVECDEDRKLLVGELMKRADFNSVFNELFEKNKLSGRHTSVGHGDWLKSDDDIDNRKATRADMHTKFTEKKLELGAVVPLQAVMGLGSSDGSSELAGDGTTFTSDVFSSLPFDDVRIAHTQTVVPVWEDSTAAPRCSSVEELRLQRANSDGPPPSLTQARKMLSDRRDSERSDDVHRAFRLAKEDEAAREKTEAWLGSFKRLTDS